MHVTIELGTVRDLAVVIGTAIPVLVVAFYAAVNAAEAPDRTQDLGRIPVPAHWGRVLDSGLRRRALVRLGSMFMTKCGDVEPEADAANRQLTKKPSYVWELRVMSQFRVGTGMGFSVRSGLSFVLCMATFTLLDAHQGVAVWCLAASLALTVWSLQALITYSSVVTALSFEAGRRRRSQAEAIRSAGTPAQVATRVDTADEAETDVAESHEGFDPDPETVEIVTDRLDREWQHAWNLLLFANITSGVLVLGTGLVCALLVSAHVIPP